MAIGTATKSLLCVCLLTTATAHAATINGSVNFLGGALGTWSVNFTSSAPPIQLQKLVIQLPATYGFDTQSGGFGLLTSQDFFKVSGGATAAALTPSTAATRDGATQVTIDFTGFNTAAGTFLFLLDVDGAAPTLAVCPSGLAGIPCVAANLLLTTAASTVDGSEMAGATAQLTFGGVGYSTVTLPATFARTGLLTAQADFATEIPEPATFALLGVGLTGLALVRRCRA